MNRSVYIVIALLLFGSGYIFVNIDDLLKTKSTPLAKIGVKRGKVTTRPIDLTIWRDIDPEQFFYSGDVIATEAGSYAEVTFLKGRTIILDELSQVVIRAQKKSNSKDTITIRLIRGQVQTAVKASNKKSAINKQPTAQFKLISGQQTIDLKNAEARVIKRVGQKTSIQVKSGQLLLSDGRAAPQILTQKTNPEIPGVSFELLNKPPEVKGPSPLDTLNLTLNRPVVKRQLRIISPIDGFYFASAKRISIPVTIENPQVNNEVDLVFRISINGKIQTIRGRSLVTNIPLELTSLVNRISIEVVRRDFRKSEATNINLTSLPHVIESGKWLGLDRISKTKPSAVFRQKKFGSPRAFIRFASTADLKADSAILRNASVLTITDRPRVGEQIFLVDNHKMLATMQGDHRLIEEFSAVKDIDFSFKGDVRSLVPIKQSINQTISQTFRNSENLYLMNQRQLFSLKRKTVELIPELQSLMGSNIQGIFKKPVEIVWTRGS